MNVTYLLTGGNLGRRVENLNRAMLAIREDIGEIISHSAVYETAAWGKTNQPDFLNQALEVHTPLTPEEVLEALLEIEKKLGRLRSEKYDARTIDIDILFYNQSVIQTPHLIIPHPHLHNRRFVLTPLADIAAYYQHPVLGKTIAQLLFDCPDSLHVKKFSL